MTLTGMKKSIGAKDRGSCGLLKESIARDSSENANGRKRNNRILKIMADGFHWKEKIAVEISSFLSSVVLLR